MQEAEALEQAQRLIKKLDVLRSAQKLILPHAPAMVVNADQPWLTHIAFPSSLDIGSRDKVKRLCDMEDGLREALAREALEALQRHLRTRDVALDFKNQHVRGVRGCTRMNDQLKAVVVKVRAAADAYRRHSAALLTLRPPGPWCKELQPLLDVDIRGINERALSADEAAQRERVRMLAQELSHPVADDDNFEREEGVGGVHLGRAPVQVGESRRALSWIWCNTAMLEAGADDTRMTAGKADALYFT